MSGEREYLRLGLRLLDEQLVDCTGRRIGRLEDLEFDAGVGEPARMTAILCGATAWKRRLPPRLSELFPGDPRGLRRVPYHQIGEISNEIHLVCEEDELDRSTDTEAAPLAVSQLIGTSLVGRDGDGLGRIREVVAVRPKDSEELWRLHGVLPGRAALRHRAGFDGSLEDRMSEGSFPENFVEWERLERFDEQGRLVLRR